MTEQGNIANSRSLAQVAHMEKTVGQGKCPFCDGNGFDPKLNIVVWSGEYWRAWLNPFPYTGTATHIIIASHQHVTDISDVPADAWAEWGTLNKYLIEKYKLPGGGIVMRFGENSFNGGTLFHIHSHIQVPDKKWFCIAVFYKDSFLSKFLDSAFKRAQKLSSKKKD